MAWAPDYITTGELKAYLRIDALDVVDDVELADAVSAASRAVDGLCNRQFGLVAAPEERFYDAVWDRHRCGWFVQLDDLMTEVGLTVEDADGNTPSSWTLLPRNAPAGGKPWTEAEVPGSGTYGWTARWGWSAVPAPVVPATKLQASRFHARRDSPYGVAGSPQDGSEMRLLSRVDPDVEVMLRRGKLVREWWAR